MSGTDIDFGFIHFDQAMPSAEDEEVTLELFVKGKLTGFSSILMKQLVNLKSNQLVKQFVLSLHLEKGMKEHIFRDQSVVQT